MQKSTAVCSPWRAQRAESAASPVLFPSLEQIMIYLFFCTCCPASLLTKGEELEIPASLSRHCSTISAALDTRVCEEEQPTETRLEELIAHINIWLLFSEFSE